MLKPTVAIGLVSFIVLSQSAIALAVTVRDIPNPRRMNSWVADTADLLTPQTEAEIDRIATELAARNGSEIAVVTVPTTKPAQSSKAFATQLFNTWKIGKQGKNNGVLFLISKSDRRTEIETGTGLTTLLPNSKVEMILTQTVTPQYKQGKFNEGTVAGTRAIAEALSGSPAVTASKTSTPHAGGAFAILLLLYFTISGIMKGFRGGSSSDLDGSSSDGGGSDSTSSDFGGGSSDGGGSGDSW